MAMFAGTVVKTLSYHLTYLSILVRLQHGFDNMFSLLKPGGFIVFSVPYNLAPAEHLEHYPDLYDYTIKEGEHVLYNRTSSGKREKFRDLVFHGGPGSTLEMRVLPETRL